MTQILVVLLDLLAGRATAQVVIDAVNAAGQFLTPKALNEALDVVRSVLKWAAEHNPPHPYIGSTTDEIRAYAGERAKLLGWLDAPVPRPHHATPSDQDEARGLR